MTDGESEGGDCDECNMATLRHFHFCASAQEVSEQNGWQNASILSRLFTLQLSVAISE